ncbi:MAG TPA: hypothetical protein VMB49_17715 [Acidobacteriaceae bacterium]|nr:hypothetical protein [Acidobacteriaceae bacterium]
MAGLTGKNLSLAGVGSTLRRASSFLIVTTFFGCAASAQVFVVQREHLGPKDANLTTVQPTSVVLDKKPITERTKQQLIRTFQADEAFAVRPLPLGTKGVTLHANGQLTPSGNGYADELEKYGISSKPGDRVVITKFEVRPDRIIFEFNNGPEKHHHILQHIEVGGMGGMAPIAQDDGQVPVGSRMFLVFDKFVPEMNAFQVRKLIAPMIDFSLKTPAQAFADTLPPKLKNAVLGHEVLVGMNREMVLKAMGQPDQKVREMDGQMPFEEWIYGTPPHEVQFVRFNGNRVIRLEIADVGQPPIIRDKDETDGYFAGQFVHQVRLGDAPPAAPNQEHGPTAAPSLRQPGEDLPNAVDKDHQLKPVQYPDDEKPKPIPPPPGSAPASQLVNVSEANAAN